MKRILGYRPIYEPEPATIVTQAFVLCSLCGGAIRATGGPISGAVCLGCLNNLPSHLVFTIAGPKGTGVADEGDGCPG